MDERELARALINAGLLGPQQVQAAVARRAAGVSFAQALVELGMVSQMDIMQIDPYAFQEAAPQDPNWPETPAYDAGGYDAQAYQAAGYATPTYETPTYETATYETATYETPVYAPPAYEEATPHVQVGLGQDAESEITNDSIIVIQGEEANSQDESASPIVRYCNELLKFAIMLRASDIHFEPREDGLLPRYRVDGHLQAKNVLPHDIQAPIISRLKVLGGLDITENRLPQDGRFRATIGARVFDFRVSSLPALHGEKIVLRVLDRSSLVTDLTRLGFSGESRDTFEAMLRRSHGMILVTGPTGSGKTTTLYAALAATRDDTKNVVTVEDPVEYELGGVTQTNVQADIGLTFAQQLRAILRQDPDVILVGEIRDSETADIAVRAALTGHLVLSTLHTNSAVGAVTRLQDMDVAPFLIASSVTGVLAQRLVRLICRHCRTPLPPDSPGYYEHLTALRLPEDTVLYHGAGCSECNGSGMRGRLAIVELLNVDSDMRKAIMAQADSGILRRIAIAGGMKTLWQDGIEKLLQGLTTADEVERVLLSGDVEESEQE